jgi:hypothetical protein
MEAFAVADGRDAKVAAVVRRLIASGDFLGAVHLAQRTPALELRRDALASLDRAALIAAAVDERLATATTRRLAAMPDKTRALDAVLLERTGVVSEAISAGMSALEGRAGADWSRQTLRNWRRLCKLTKSSRFSQKVSDCDVLV